MVSFTPSFLKINFNIIMSQNWSLPSGFPTKTFYAFISSMRAASSAHRILINLITLVILSEENELLFYSLCNFFQFDSLALS
jgi:hypothetical protein